VNKDDDDDDDKSASLTVRIRLLSELKSTLLGKLFHVFTARSLKNLLREGVGKIETRPQLFGYCLNAQRQKTSG